MRVAIRSKAKDLCLCHGSYYGCFVDEHGQSLTRHLVF
jgi:hypothetical protein